MSRSLVHEMEVTDRRIRVRAVPSLAQQGIREEFFLEYEEGMNLQALPRWAILTPFLLNVAPIIWLSGERYSVESMDEDLLRSLAEVRATFERMHPGLSWEGEIEAESVVSAPTPASNGNCIGVLFSGGVDSTSSSLRHSDHPQVLFTYWGNDVALENRTGWRRVRDQCAAFARLHGHTPVFARSNLRSFIDTPRLEERWTAIPNWWAYVQHGLGLVGLAVPALVAMGCGQLVIAATHWGEETGSWGSRPSLEGRLRWGGAAVIHDGFDRSRHQRLSEIVRFYRERALPRPTLRVCFAYPYGDGGNCGHCEKCLRTIAGLLVEGEPFEEYGFETSATHAMALARRRFRTRRMPFSAGKAKMWREIQERWRERSGDASPAVAGEARQALQWLGGFDFDRYNRRWGRVEKVRSWLIRSVRRRPRLERFVRKRLTKLRGHD